MNNYKEKANEKIKEISEEVIEDLFIEKIFDKLNNSERKALWSFIYRKMAYAIEGVLEDE